MNNDILVLQVLVITAGTAVLITSLKLLARYLELRRRPEEPLPGTPLSLRLERIEQIVEATAVEVERIAEANRYMAKLLTERGTPVTPPSRPERVITPH